MKASPPESAARGWHIDKTVPIALISALVFQSLAIVWGASNLWTRVDLIERQMVMGASQPERIIRLETKVDGLASSLAEIKDLMRQR